MLRFLVGIVAWLAFLAPAQSQQFHVPSAGLTVLNCCDPFNFSSFPFANLLLQLSAGSSTSATTPAYPGQLDANGFPSSASFVGSNRTVPLPTSACVSTSHCILDWQGTNGNVSNPGVSVQVGSQINIVSGSGFVSGSTAFNMNTFGVNGSIEFYFSNPQSSVAFDFSANAPYALTQMRLYRVRDQVGLNANPLYPNPDFVSAMSLNPNMLRGMDFRQTNTNITTSLAFEHPSTALSQAGGVWVSSLWAGDASGTDTYTATLAGFTLTDGATIQLRFVNANTSTTPTLNVSGLGAVTIENTSAGALSAGTIGANSLWTLIYDQSLNKFIGAAGTNAAGGSTAAQVAMCNSLFQNCWINLPCHANIAYATSIANYVKANLNRSLIAAYEYCNEVWNFGFAQTSWAEARSAALGFSSLYNSFYGLQFCQLMGAITTAYGSQTNFKRVLAFQAFGPVSTINSNRLQGSELAAFGCNSAPNRPVDFADYLSYATYYQGAVLGGGYSGTYAVGDLAACSVPGTNSGGLQCAADNYALGTPMAIAAAFAWVDNDVRNGTKNGASASPDQTLNGLSTNIYPAWNTIAASYSLPILTYEGGFQEVAPTVTQCGTISFPGTAATYCGPGGLIDVMLTGYKNSVTFQKLVTDQMNQMLAASPAGSRAGWYSFSFSGDSPWSLYPTDIYSTPYRSWNAINIFNHQNFLLKRDLDPAANDNTPMWVERAA